MARLPHALLARLKGSQWRQLISRIIILKMQKPSWQYPMQHSRVKSWYYISDFYIHIQIKIQLLLFCYRPALALVSGPKSNQPVQSHREKPRRWVSFRLKFKATRTQANSFVFGFPIFVDYWMLPMPKTSSNSACVLAIPCLNFLTPKNYKAGINASTY